MENKHTPVLLHQALQPMKLHEGDNVADLTFGFGGHSREILKKIGESGRLYAFDKDPYMIENGKKQFPNKNIIWINDSFANVRKYIPENELNACIADLGVSSYHFDTPERGFSFSHDGPLDMRLNPTLQTRTAADVVNTFSEKELAHIFRTYGEENNAFKIAIKIKQYTNKTKIKTTSELARIVASVGPKQRKLHPATKVFQALRIFINEELGELARMLEEIRSILATDAVLSIISFHSLEDRIVKQFLHKEGMDCICDKSIPICICHHKAQFEILTKKPIVPTEEEIQSNPRARSAKLRIAVKK